MDSLIDGLEAPDGIEVRRELEEEKQNPRYIYYKIYFKDELIGIANYRLFSNQSPYWYIDEFITFESHRDQGYGTYLLKYIVQKMWDEQHIPIHIFPTGQQIPKEDFIAWLVNRGFTETLDSGTGQTFCILYPYQD